MTCVEAFCGTHVKDSAAEQSEHDRGYSGRARCVDVDGSEESAGSCWALL